MWLPSFPNSVWERHCRKLRFASGPDHHPESVITFNQVRDAGIIAGARTAPVDGLETAFVSGRYLPKRRFARY
jgi:hypothetical protein